MKKAIVLASACLVLLVGVVNAAGPSGSLAVGKSSPAEILDAAYQEIMRYQVEGWDVPEEMYNFYFRLEEQLHPEYYQTRQEGQTLDEFSDACPGPVIEGPGDDDSEFISSCGQTNTAHNDCTVPDGRYGRDMVVQLEVNELDAVIITTAGSRFDTYLAIFEDACCGEEEADLVASNDNNPLLCNGQRLASGIATCLDEGTYFIVVDGATPAARGSFCLNIEFLGDGCEF